MSLVTCVGHVEWYFKLTPTFSYPPHVQDVLVSHLYPQMYRPHQHCTDLLTPGAPSVCPQALTYLVLISEVDETEIFKICLEYWNVLAGDLYRENPFTSPTNPFPFLARVSSQPQGRRALYSGVLTKVRQLGGGEGDSGGVRG